MSLAEDVDAARVRKSHIQLMVYFSGIVGFGGLLLLTRGSGHFVPAGATVYWAPTAIMALDALVVGTIVFAMWPAISKQRWTGLGVVLSMLFVVPAIVGILTCVSFMGFFLFDLGLPELYTREYGTPSIRQMTVTEWRPGSRHSCAGVYLKENLLAGVPLCLRDKVMPGAVLTLHGKQSTLGFDVTSISL